jgi:hypothetical protein
MERKKNKRDIKEENAFLNMKQGRGIAMKY